MTPADFGYQVAKVREGLVLPAVPTKVPTIPLTAPVPLPVVAVYSRRQPDTVSTDPEARRQRAEGDVPSLLEDPGGWFDAEARRIARTISNDRGMDDHFVDAPTSGAILRGTATASETMTRSAGGRHPTSVSNR